MRNCHQNSTIAGLASYAFLESPAGKKISWIVGHLKLIFCEGVLRASCPDPPGVGEQPGQSSSDLRLTVDPGLLLRGNPGTQYPCHG